MFGDDSNKPKSKVVEPVEAFRLDSVRFLDNGKVEVDWEALGLLRELDEDELLCLRIYADFRIENGGFPKSEMKHSLIYRKSKEYRPNDPIRKSTVDNYLFVDLFPFNVDINFTVAMRRLLSDSRGHISELEYEQALKFLFLKMNEGNEQDLRKVPTTADVDNAVRSGLMVPGLATLMPSSSAIMHGLKPKSWAEVCAGVLGATKEEIAASLAVRYELQDLVDDYKRAFHDRFPNYDGTSECILTFEDLEDFKLKGGLGLNRYKQVLARERKNGNPRCNLNTVRGLANLPIDLRLENRESRPKAALKLDTSHICLGYLAAWRFIGFEFDPPSRVELNKIVDTQSRLLRDGHYYEVDPSSSSGKFPLQGSSSAKVGNVKVLDPHVAKSAGVPCELVPSHQLICKHFDNMAHLLGRIESIRGTEVKMENNLRLSRMGTEVIKTLKKNNNGVLPRRSSIELYLEKIPDCISDVVRDRPEISKILGSDPSSRQLIH